MKEFNLEQAKAGKPVCTRDGRKVRIVCFDVKTAEYSILALIEKEDRSEIGVFYKEDGRYYTSSRQSDDDLMMASEKHEGWAIILRRHGDTCVQMSIDIYATEEEARNVRLSAFDKVAIIHIVWEE